MKFFKQKAIQDPMMTEFIMSMSKQSQVLTDLALEIGIDKISDVIAKCNFEYYSAINRTHTADYILNVRPNVNQTATDFWKQAVKKMIKETEGCLIVPGKDKQLFIAESYEVDQMVQRERTYTNVVICVDDDTMQLTKRFKASEVIHLKYSNPKVITLLEKVNKMTEVAHAVALGSYKSKASKLLVKMQATARLQNADGKIITSNEYADEIAKKIGGEEVKAILVSNGIDVSMLENKNSISASDIKTLKDEIFTNTALALSIPKSVFYGEVSEKSDANNEFITYACEPIIQIINNALNGALLEKSEYANGDRFYIDTRCVKHIDVIESAGQLDKLYQNGWSHNDILKLLGQPSLNENWANERRFTKNYSGDIAE